MWWCKKKKEKEYIITKKFDWDSTIKSCVDKQIIKDYFKKSDKERKIREFGDWSK